MGDLSSGLWVSLYEMIVVTLTIPEQRAERWDTECQDSGSLPGSKPDLHTKGGETLSKRSPADSSRGFLFLWGHTENPNGDQ